jgi:hypothetical protein
MMMQLLLLRMVVVVVVVAIPPRTLWRPSDVPRDVPIPNILVIDPNVVDY